MLRFTSFAAALLVAPSLAAQTLPNPVIESPTEDTGAAGPALPGAPRVVSAGDTPTPSRNAPVNGVLTLFGNERCPTNKDGAEIVVCVRRSAQEQFRIPKELRNFEITPENASWAVKEQANRDVGNVGIGSCTTVGPGGGTGCFIQNARRARADNKAREKAATPDLDN